MFPSDISRFACLARTASLQIKVLSYLQGFSSSLFCIFLRSDLSFCLLCCLSFCLWFSFSLGFRTRTHSTPVYSPNFFSSFYFLFRTRVHRTAQGTPLFLLDFPYFCFGRTGDRCALPMLGWCGLLRRVRIIKASFCFSSVLPLIMLTWFRVEFCLCLVSSTVPGLRHEISRCCRLSVCVFLLLFFRLDPQFPTHQLTPTVSLVYCFLGFFVRFCVWPFSLFSSACATISHDSF